jgi:hypothetical protein
MVISKKMTSNQFRDIANLLMSLNIAHEMMMKLTETEVDQGEGNSWRESQDGWTTEGVGRLALIMAVIVASTEGTLHATAMPPIEATLLLQAEVRPPLRISVPFVASGWKRGLFKATPRERSSYQGSMWKTVRGSVPFPPSICPQVPWWSYHLM